MRLIMGYLMLVPAWIAVMFLLSVSLGPTILICLVAIVAVADVGAYFAGRFLGKHKLAPSVSPGKTWEGFWGGFFASTAFGVLVWWLRPVELSHLNLSAVLAITLTTSLASVVGDLMVSMVKRESGYKDSGNLLPGHGGVLDRLDSICGAAPIFALGYMLAHW
jgi:phosphatidate cytidylyltransferase